MDKERAEPEKLRIWREEQKMMLEKKGIVSYSAAETKKTTLTANNTYSQQHIQPTTHTVHNTQYNHIAVINTYTTKLGLSQT